MLPLKMSSILLILFTVLKLGSLQSTDHRVYKPVIADLLITVQAKEQQLELRWRNFNLDGGHIVLTNDPVNAESFKEECSRFIFWTTCTWRYQVGSTWKTALSSFKPDRKESWRTINAVVYDRNSMKQVNVQTSCYGYYGFFVDKSGKISSRYCMKAYPTWMKDLRNNLGKRRLRDLFIPGTHDSAASSHDIDRQYLNNVVNGASVTQDDNIWDQLLQGIRYIDLRVGYYPKSNPQFYGNHGPIKFDPLPVILDHVRRFVQQTNEIVILDAHDFTDFGTGCDIHDKLIQFIKNSIGQVMADPAIGWNANLNDIWAQNRTVILAYNDNCGSQRHANEVWQPVHQNWGNVQELDDLKKYLYAVHEGFPSRSANPPEADMAELTQRTIDTVTGYLGNLRDMADRVNRDVAQWYFGDLGPTSNIVAVDFLRGTSIVEAALYWNLKKN